MNGMFYYAYAFNNGGQAFNWNTGLVTNMNNMFQNATVFNQDISHWCVTNISTLPTSFVSSSPLASQTAKIPVW
ncbi:MAG: DUF285 domain-containing protein [Candidatus Peribacteria bacterium]|jgi:hypothetical protein|nr:DUF285 domain-containing protein [Candidatus Peribacteria bacterium]